MIVTNGRYVCNFQLSFFQMKFDIWCLIVWVKCLSGFKLFLMLSDP